MRPHAGDTRCDIALLVDVETGEHSRSGSFVPEAGTMESEVLRALRQQHAHVEVVPFGPVVTATMELLQRLRPRLVFNLTEWLDGDRRLDAAIAGMLEMLNLAYTGTGPAGMQLARDKAVAKRIVSGLDIAVPRHVVMTGNSRGVAGQRFPVILKPQFGDGSDGIANAAVVRDRRALALRARSVMRRVAGPLLCEEYIPGRDLFVALLGNEPQVMPPLELVIGRRGNGAPNVATSRVKSDASYRARWRIRYRIAPLDAALTARIEEASRRIFHALQLRDYGRIDYRLTPEGELVFLEANHNPDLAPHTFGRNRCFAGVEYGDLIASIVAAAQRRCRKEKARQVGR
jgi:D-alanine-D-alanine ligase